MANESVVDRLTEVFKSNDVKDHGKITIKKTFPVTLVTAGIATLLKITGMATIPWWGIVTIALFPLVVVLSLVAVVLAGLLAVGLSYLAFAGVVTLWERLTTKRSYGISRRKPR